MTFLLCQAKEHSRLALPSSAPSQEDRLHSQAASPGGTRGKEPICKCRRERRGSIPGSGRSPRGGQGSPLQYSCLENPMDTGAWGLRPRGRKGQGPDSTHTGGQGVW